MNPSPLPLVDSNHALTQNPRTRDALLSYFLPFISMTITSGAIFQRACTNNDLPMAVFIAFIFFVSVSVDYYCFGFNHNLIPNSKTRRFIKMVIWVLLSVVMLGFGCAFSTFMDVAESLCFFGVVIGGNAFLFYAYLGDEEKGSVNVEHYAHVFESFVPVMLLFFCLSRNYLTPLPVIHAAIRNGRKINRRPK
ncbi:uncharacterized protein LOC113868017 [Abrus precatorius]|uniref:Uncharacterized protein LOC113868017 n=1 Tax=Abrus precatorius TaxID=3816 RepID=A0A8B8LWU9_ABRPR|nr:uncharacterized protein LOC113868017 [Abrus precatorius]